MAVIVPFRAIRPRKPFVRDVASYPYDVLNAEEAERLMLLVHHEGRAVVATGHREAMERDALAMHGFGLWATAAPADL